MKNIQIIDGAENCTYDIFAVTDDEFLVLFGRDDVEILFYEDVEKRDDQDGIDGIFENMWSRPVEKRNADGIHGTIFYEQYFKKKYFAEGRWDASMVGKI